MMKNSEGSHKRGNFSQSLRWGGGQNGNEWEFVSLKKRPSDIVWLNGEQAFLTTVYQQ
jgi:hypothetical protein